MTLGQRLYEMRKAKGLSQEQTAEILGVTRQTISKWESDQTTPDFDKILPLCDLYNISSDELLKGETKQDVSTDAFKNDASTDDVYKNEPAQSPNQLEDFNRRKIKSSIIMSVAIGLYILSVIPFFVIKNSNLALSVFFVIIALATIMIVFSALSRPKRNKSQPKSNEYKLYKQITGILASVVLVIYMLVSFISGMWHITWLMWVIYGIVCEIIKLVFSLKGCEINENEQ